MRCVVSDLDHSDWLYLTDTAPEALSEFQYCLTNKAYPKVPRFSFRFAWNQFCFAWLSFSETRFSFASLKYFWRISTLSYQFTLHDGSGGRELLMDAFRKGRARVTEEPSKEYDPKTKAKISTPSYFLDKACSCL